MGFFKIIMSWGFVLLAIWAIGFMSFAISAMNAAPQSPDETSDAIVVFTGGSDRTHTGLALFADGRAAHLFISGVYPEVKKSEILALWDGAIALPPCCVSLGYEATTTVENAVETRDWVIEHGYTSLRLVTGDFHMHRAAQELKHALPGIDIYKHPIVQSDHPHNSRYYWVLMLSEYHKTLYRQVQLMLSPQEALPAG